MKKLLLISFMLLALSSALFAQRFKGAIMGGMNISQVDGDEVVGYNRVGGHLGVAAILPLNNWDITLETVFNQKGAWEKQQYRDTINDYVYTGQYDLRLNYVEVPLMAHYTDRGWITAGAGVSWGRLVSFNETEHGGSVPPYSDTVSFNKNDFDILVDLQFRIYQRLKFNIRYAYSLAPIREREYKEFYTGDEWSRRQYNNLFTFRLVYIFNEALPPKRTRGE
jgi:hypothetical protein